MKKVKIVLVQDTNCYDEYSSEIIRSGITDWEEISDEDYKFLNSNIHRIVNPPYGFRAILLEYDEMSVAQRISNLRDIVAAERRRIEEEKEKREEQKRQRALKKIAKDEEAERKLFEQLKNKFEA